MKQAGARNFFVISLAAAAVVHLIGFGAVLLVFPSQDVSHEKGMSFLGSILDSSQMEREPFLKQALEKDRVVFSPAVPPRSEKKYFEDLKDIKKPKVDISEQKKNAKTLFSVLSRSSQKESRWQAKDSLEYQPLKLTVSP